VGPFTNGRFEELFSREEEKKRKEKKVQRSPTKYDKIILLNSIQ